MKKILILALFSVSIHAQKSSFYGFKLGPNLSDLRYDGLSSIPAIPTSSEHKVGLGIGLFFNQRLSERFGFQPEILYVNKRANVEVPYEFQRSEAEEQERCSIHYLEVPLLITYDLPTSRPFFIFAGPAVGKRLMASPSHKSGSRAPRTNQSDVSYVIGGGLKFPYRSGRWTIDLRMNFGSPSCFAFRNNDFEEVAYRIRTISLMMGLPF